MTDNIFTDNEKIGLTSISAKKLITQCPDCIGVTVDGGEVAKRRIGAMPLSFIPSSSTSVSPPPPLGSSQVICLICSESHGYEEKFWSG